MTREEQELFRESNTAFKSGDMELYNTGRATLKRGIKRAMVAYKRRIEDCYKSNDPLRCGKEFSTLLTTDPAPCQLMTVEPHWQRNPTAASLTSKGHQRPHDNLQPTAAQFWWWRSTE